MLLSLLKLMSMQGNGIPSVPPPLAWPSNFAFLFETQDVEPDFSKQSSRNKGGRWIPPHKKKGLKRIGNPSCFRWKNGVPETMTVNEFRPLVHHREPFDTATVFCADDSFWAVPFNAREEQVRDNNLGDWKDIGFQYVRLMTSAQTPQLYASLDYAPGYTRLPAQGTSRWITDLFPSTYHWQANDAFMPNAVSAGLIGRLPLIFSLVSFSCAAENAAHYTRHCVLRQRWVPHNRPHGSKSTETHGYEHSAIMLRSHRDESTRNYRNRLR